MPRLYFEHCIVAAVFVSSHAFIEHGQASSAWWSKLHGGTTG